MPDGESERTMAQCTSCGSAYAAEIWPDGTIQPIGAKDGCQYGSTNFQVIENSADAHPRNEKTD